MVSSAVLRPWLSSCLLLRVFSSLFSTLGQGRHQHWVRKELRGGTAFLIPLEMLIFTQGVPQPSEAQCHPGSSSAAVLPKHSSARAFPAARLEPSLFSASPAARVSFSPAWAVPRAAAQSPEPTDCRPCSENHPPHTAAPTGTCLRCLLTGLEKLHSSSYEVSCPQCCLQSCCRF